MGHGIGFQAQRSDYPYKMFLQDVINDCREGLILSEDGCLLRSEWRAYVIDRSGAKGTRDNRVVLTKCARDGGSDGIEIIFDPRGNNLAVWNGRVRDEEPEILGGSNLVVSPFFSWVCATKHL